MDFATFGRAIHSGIMKINGSKLFAGIMMLLMNILSKAVVVQMSDTHAEYVRNTIGRELLIFSIVFVATHDIYISTGMTAAFYVLTAHLFNPNSKLCVLPPHMQALKKVVDKNKDGYVSENEVDEAVKILERARQQKQQIALELFHQNKI